MNKVILIGRLTRDPEFSYFGSDNKACASFTLAVDRRIKKEGEQNADFVSCVAFGKTAEFLEKYVRKGTKLVVEGRIQTGSYTNKDGNKVYTTDVLVDTTEFAESKNSNSNAKPEPAPEPEGFMNIPDSIEEELPFA